MTRKIKRRSLRCGGRPKADFGSIFTTFIAPALGVAGSVADSAIAKHQANKVVTTPAANTQVPEPKSNPEPKVDATGNNGTTVLPPDPTKTPAMRLGGRKKCWIGAAIMGATSIAGSLFGAAAQKREMRRQKNIQDWQNTTQEAANMTSVLNNSQDYQEDYLRQFRTAARLGKTLGAKGIYITDGGNATKIGSNTYLLRGGSHEDVNETGQTGIGINVGGNEVEAEGGEVAQKKNGALRIFSAQPILSNGMSPAQAILRGYNKDSVFSQQQAFKKRNGLKDDGSAKYGLGGDIKGIVKSKVYSKYPSLRPKAAFGDWVRTNRDDNALADLLYESGLFDRESWNTMLRDIHDFTGMGSNPYNTDDNVDAVMAPAFTSSSSRMLSQLAKSPEASYTLKQVLGLPTKEMVRKRIAGDIAKRIGVARAARQSSNFRNYNIARMQAANAEASFSPFANQVRYAEGKPILVNTNGYYTTAGNTISRNARNMTSGANPFLYAPRTSDEVLEGLNRVISSAKQGAKSAGQKVGNKFKGTPGQKLSDAYYDLTPMQRAKLKGLTLAATLSIPADYFVESQNGRNKKSTPVQKDAHGKPISQYIARPQTPVQQLSRPQVKKATPAQKSVVVPKQGNKTVHQYKGNTTKGNYQLHDGETRTINGIKYTRRGNAIINHKTNVAYIYDKNGNYTGKADYSKVGNFNQAFDAARAAGRSQFIYRAGKYNNYSTIKETNAKKERLNRIVGARRVAKALGGYSRPVEGMRPKAGTGMYIPFNKRYTSIYDAPDYDYDYNGGNVLGNNEVTVTAKRIKPTFMKPNNDAMNLIKVPKEEVPYIPQHHNRSRTIFSGGDYLGLGIDTLAALSTGLVNYNTAGKYTLPDRAPIIQASKLPTTYNVNPEIEEVKRYRDRLTGQTFNNTSSSVAALNRSGAINLDALSNLSKLWATKENEENKMLTEDAKNQQTVAAQNVQNELARQSEIARIKNEATQAKGDALNVGLSGLSQAWTNFWTAGRTAYEDDQTRRAMIASSKEATPTRLSEMDFDLSPDILASLYRTAKDDRTRRFYLSRLSPKQRLKYGIN